MSLEIMFNINVTKKWFGIKLTIMIDMPYNQIKPNQTYFMVPL